MAQEQRRQAAQNQHDDHYIPDPAPEGTPTATAAQAHSLDSLLDEIDDVLEVNAEEFVQGFVQKGGQ